MAPRNKSQVSCGDQDEQDDFQLSSMTDSDCSNTDYSGSKKTGGQKRSHKFDKCSDEYKRRRERNNIAVKKSRSKSKLKTMQTLERVNQLRAENEMLESKIKLLSKELSFLKDLFLAHAGSAHGQNLQDLDLTSILEDTTFSNSPDITSGNESGKDDVNSDALKNDHKYTVHANVKVES